MAEWNRERTWGCSKSTVRETQLAWEKDEEQVEHMQVPNWTDNSGVFCPAKLGQGYVKERLKSSLKKFYGRYGDLTKQYEVPPLPNVTRYSGCLTTYSDTLHW